MSRKLTGPKAGGWQKPRKAIPKSAEILEKKSGAWRALGFCAVAFPIAEAYRTGAIRAPDGADGAATAEMLPGFIVCAQELSDRFCGTCETGGTDNSVVSTGYLEYVRGLFPGKYCKLFALFTY